MQEKIGMSKVLKAISISLLWMAGLGSVCAEPAREWRDTLRIERQQRSIERGQDGLRRERSVERQDTQSREQYQVAPDSRRRGGAQAPLEIPGPHAVDNRVFNVVPDEPRRPGRLTPEERRALRRQINEAGRDIYAPRR